ncbi:MAG: hypothetical protein JRJ20_01485 [Deltaproteobacteria bacterium]|nr:hypothetical protein [Deltaproteobacteria bacterium]MBW2142863.1 hypothetical protein [Deltaproteobacteria bacterium]
MKILHILKTDLDDITNALLSALGTTHGQESTVIRLDDSTDYEKLIDIIFDHDKVITWW